jgi:hypothetical protein
MAGEPIWLEIDDVLEICLVFPDAVEVFEHGACFVGIAERLRDGDCPDARPRISY